MLEMFIFETTQLLEQLEQEIISSEKSSCLVPSSINEIFRIMHTIKGSSAMMLFNNISTLAHSIEDLFYFIRENHPREIDFCKLSDVVLEGIDFIKKEVSKIESGKEADGSSFVLIAKIKEYLSQLKNIDGSPKASEQEQKEESTQKPNEQRFYISSQKKESPSNRNFFRATVFFEEDCGMENIRAFSIVHEMKEFADYIVYTPSDLMDNEESVETIRENGFCVTFNAAGTFEDMKDFFMRTFFIKDLQLEEIQDEEKIKNLKRKKEIILEGQNYTNTYTQNESEKNAEQDSHTAVSKQNMISVNVPKLDKLMDLVGELVISEAMVTQNPELQGLQLNGFYKAARQLKKITDELQDIVMSIRMVPLYMTFQKMNRIIRDMSKKLNKEVKLEIIGEETEVDKNIIEHISDPLMHLIRNSIDHGIESSQERIQKGKPEIGHITLEAKNAGGEVLIFVKDDGRGLDRNKILNKARDNGLLNKPENELTDREIFSFIFLPGFSTKESVTEFSGRGVGMDVATKNIEAVGGSIVIDSKPEQGTIVTIKIPLTLAIIDGMTIKAGASRFTIPTNTIKESFRVSRENVIVDADNNEIIMVRGECYPVLRLHQIYNLGAKTTCLNEGIIVMIENDSRRACIFADELIGEQQVVVKALPNYLKKVSGISGCTLLGDGGISLIMDGSDLLG